MPTPRRPQQARSATTRARVLEAAFDSLVEDGYAATTVGQVQQRAGVARGTLLHHFPTRDALMAGVLEDIIERRLAMLTAVEDVPDAPPGDWDDVVELIWHELQRPPFAAGLELWVAARTDEDLRAALAPLQERIYDTVTATVARLLGEERPEHRVLVRFTIDLLTGSRMGAVLAPTDGLPPLVEEWKRALRTLAHRG